MSANTGVTEVLLRPAQSRRAVRHLLPAPPARLDADQRRPGVDDLQVHGRRQDLAQGRQRPAQGRQGADRPRRLAGQPGRASTPSSKRPRTRAACSARPTAARPGRSAASTPVAPRASTTTSCSPTRKDVDRVYSMDTWLHVSDDGGKTWRKVGEKTKHVDNHAHVDRPGRHRPPAGRLRRRPLRDLGPRQDLGLQGQPAGDPVLPRRRRQRDAVLRRLRRHPGQQLHGRPVAHHRRRTGIANSDWFVTNGGDGFVRRIEPENPNIVYAESQHGGLVRYDRASGESIDIQPQEAPGEAPQPLELGLAADHLAALADPALLRVASGSTAATTAATTGRRSPATSPGRSTATSSRSWTRCGPPTPWPRTPRRRSTATSCRSPSRRWSRACSTWAPTTAWSRSARTAGKAWRKVETFPGVPSAPT